MYFHISLIPRGAYFLLPLESKQEAASGWNVTKWISEVKVNQLKVKNIHVKMDISTFKTNNNTQGMPQKVISVDFESVWWFRIVYIFAQSLKIQKVGPQFVIAQSENIFFISLIL